MPTLSSRSISSTALSVHQRVEPAPVLIWLVSSDGEINFNLTKRNVEKFASYGVNFTGFDKFFSEPFMKHDAVSRRIVRCHFYIIHRWRDKKKRGKNVSCVGREARKKKEKEKERRSRIIDNDDNKRYKSCRARSISVLEGTRAAMTRLHAK